MRSVSFFMAFVLLNVAVFPLCADSLVIHTSDGKTVNHAPSLLRMARRYKSQKDFISAILIYDQYLKKYPTNHHVLRELVDCHKAMINKDLEDYRAAQAAAPPALPSVVPPLPEDAIPEDPMVVTPIARALRSPDLQP